MGKPGGRFQPPGRQDPGLSPATPAQKAGNGGEFRGPFLLYVPTGSH
jgi:hypothetical protein